MTNPDIAIPYEHPLWFAPLFAALNRAGIAHLPLPMAGLAFDPAGSPPPAPLLKKAITATSCRRRSTSNPISWAEP